MDLSAINYLHWGGDKVWYIIPPGADADSLDKAVLASLSTSGHILKPCQNLMRHKDYLVTPQFLSNNGINYTVIYQKAGEFVATFPRAYHQGFNLSLNFSEASNYGSQRWLKFGRKAKLCTCRPSNLNFTMELVDDL